MTALRTPWQKVQHYFWLVSAIGCLFFALVFWAFTDSEEVTQVEKKPETEVELMIQPEKVASMTQLGALIDEVHPLDMTTRTIVNANHEAEFRGTKFVNEMKNQYVIELFRVYDEVILKNFLRKQVDRNQFTYLRLSGDNLPEQYVLLYGLYKSANEAQQALAELNMGLPKSVKPVVAQIQSYQPYVNNLGSDELTSNQKLYAVQLKNVPLPKVEESVAPRPQVQNQASSSNTQSTTSTTITRRDASGNVVDVERSESQVPSAPHAPSNGRQHSEEQEISDPFN
ncbi:hypothetical protein [Acinetobacter sp. HR7]|uniref:hypothetical protein n=1 Tax=Acinetobacter sp. HR7 TaxID=1509403 RepID=UPI0005386826|nr:hypothetical protein [Acinetobacter sp. HR7]KGT47576.1 hypothetical protein GW12_13820 [Acinetobacter sp. HR7]